MSHLSSNLLYELFVGLYIIEPFALVSPDFSRIFFHFFIFKFLKLVLPVFDILLKFQDFILERLDDVHKLFIGHIFFSKVLSTFQCLILSYLFLYKLAYVSLQIGNIFFFLCFFR